MTLTCRRSLVRSSNGFRSASARFSRAFRCTTRGRGSTAHAWRRARNLFQQPSAAVPTLFRRRGVRLGPGHAWPCLQKLRAVTHRRGPRAFACAGGDNEQAVSPPSGTRRSDHANMRYYDRSRSSPWYGQQPELSKLFTPGLSRTCLSLEDRSSVATSLPHPFKHHNRFYHV